MKKGIGEKNDYRAIAKFCGRHQRRYIAEKVVNSWLLYTAALFSVGAVCTISFRFFPWIALPVIFDAAVIITALFCIGAALNHTVRHPPSRGRIASLLESLTDKKHPLLAVALELGKSAGPAPRPLVALACAEARHTLGIYPRRIRGVISMQRIAACAISAALFAGTVFLIRPRMIAWWDLPFSLLRTTHAAITPGTLSVPRHATVSLTCAPDEPAYPSARLTIREASQTGSGGGTNLLLRPEPGGAFSRRLDSLAVSVVYTFTLGNRVFGPETVTVVPPPAIYSLAVTLTPPAYTGKKETVLPEGQGAIAALAGTRARFRIRTLFPLRSAGYRHERGDTVAFTVANDLAEGDVRLSAAGRYTFFLQDTLGQRSDSLPSFYMDILPDLDPVVRIVKPGFNTLFSPAQRETLLVEAADDFGVAALSLNWRRSNDEIDTVYTKNILPGGAFQKLVRRQVAWNLSRASLYPGDTVFYWARVRDNKPFGTPQTGVSDTFFFRVPTFEEIHKKIARREDDAGNALSSVQKLQHDMKERLESLIKSAKGKESLSWEEKRIVEDLAAGIREQADSLDKAVNALREAVEKMKESAVGDELLEKMDDLQKALQELVEKYGDSLFFAMPRADETMRWQDLRDGIEKMADLLPDLQQHLDNALKFLETLKRENERALLAQQAKKLAEEQLHIAQSHESGECRTRKQSDLLHRTERFLGELDRALQQEHSPVRMDDLPSSSEVASLQKSMQSAMKDTPMPPGDAMNRMSANLQSLGDELESTLMSALYAKAMKDHETLLGMAQDALDLSEWQDGLSRSAQNRQEWERRKKALAMEQQALKDALKKSLNNLDSLLIAGPGLMQKIVVDGNRALAAMENALEAMAGVQPGMGMAQSAHGLNALAQTLLESAQSMQQSMSGGSGSGGGMMSGLKKLSAQQAAINALTGEMLRQMFSPGGQEGGNAPQGSGKPGQAGGEGEEARRAAQKAQQQLADQLKELREQYGQSTEQRLRTRVEELEQEARRIAQMLQQPPMDLTERQDRFLVRLLQTTLSMHREEEGKEERTSKSAVTIYSSEPVAAPGQGFDKTDTFYRLRMKALSGNLPDAYRSAVENYFDALGELFLKER